MKNLMISDTKDFFINEGKPFFYLADTVWMAFTHILPEEWEEYLEFRRMQGFNAIQVSVLPILHDMSGSILDIHPFKLKSDGKYDFFNIDEAYFDRAEYMVGLLSQNGFIPVLSPLWVNYVPGTWAASRMCGNQIPLDALKPYVEYVVRRFSRFCPIYLVSGDTLFETKEIFTYYMTIMKTVKTIEPHALTTMHLSPEADLPDEFIRSPDLDFYMYQSGHLIESQSRSYILAEKFYNMSVKRPVVNGEPCYEGCKYGFSHGRFNEFDVRKAMWQSLLSGAKVGVSYGVHGIWCWHRKGINFTSEAFSGIPYDWRTALRLKGAWDYSFGKKIFELYGLFDIEPAYKILNDTLEIRMSVSRDSSKIVIYVPYNVDVNVDMDLSSYKFTLVNLTDRIFARPVVTVEMGKTVIRMHEFNSDVLIIGIK